MEQQSLEEWLPLRGRWLGYFWKGLLGGLYVLIVLGCLVLTLTPTMRTPTKGQGGLTKTQIGNFKTAVELYRVDHGGKPPTTRQGLLTLIRPPTERSDPRWKGPYLNDVNQVPLDPWRNPYVYTSPGPNGEDYLIVSYGADGKLGGEGVAEDLTNVKR